MKADNRHYKFVNSQTGNTIYYHTLNSKLKRNEVKAELDKVKAQVAIKNTLYLDVIYYEEIKND